MKLVVRVKLLPTPVQAAALEATLTACNEAATWAASVAFEERARKNLALRKLAYQDIKTRWGLGGTGRPARDQEDLRRLHHPEGQSAGRPVRQAGIETPHQRLG
ncbi:hypothetical protein ACFV2U_28685 [Streptomyces sp. NPDC059697]|uniref:hypothetical protein n=1 Tax=Streptomyces sp. NPDC059697 TaxID=3346912 RepID=UPI00368CC3EF